MLLYPDVEGCPIEITLLVLPYSQAHKFEFKLKTYPEGEVLDSATAHIGNDYLYFKCSPDPDNDKKCTSNLQWKDPNGNLLYSWPAISGPWGNGRIPQRNYLVKKPVIVSEASYCDRKGFCWWSRLIPLPGTDTKGRKGFGIHPDGYDPSDNEPPRGTKGCIGLTQDNTKPIYNKLRRYIIRFKFLLLNVKH